MIGNKLLSILLIVFFLGCAPKIVTKRITLKRTTNISKAKEERDHIVWLFKNHKIEVAVSRRMVCFEKTRHHHTYRNFIKREAPKKKVLGAFIVAAVTAGLGVGFFLAPEFFLKTDSSIPEEEKKANQIISISGASLLWGTSATFLGIGVGTLRAIAKYP